MPNFKDPVNLIATLPQVMLGYNFLYNQFTVYKTMKNPSDAKLGKAVKIAMGFAAVVCLSVGFFGYLTYGDGTTNILREHKKGGTRRCLLYNNQCSIYSLFTNWSSYHVLPDEEHCI